jgi:hypothetical protein
MLRVFKSLAVGDAIVLAGALFTGWIADSDRLINLHIALSVFASLLTALIHAAAFTYFTATGKMIRQAVFIGKLDIHYSEEVARLKTSIARSVGWAMLVLLINIALGATVWRQPHHHWWHLASAGATIMVTAYAFLHQANLIAVNAGLMDVVMNEYNAKRDSAGAPTDS